jgi:hypothetical protein
MKQGDKLICLETINNLYGDPLFEKGKIYNVLYVNNENIKISVSLNHILYANEYSEFDLEWVLQNFKKI